MKRIYIAPLVVLFFAVFLMPIHFVSAFTLGQNLITVQQGQTVYVSISASSGVSINNSSSAVATVSLSGNQISITGVSGGQTLATICVSGDSCQTLTITVPAVSAFTLSQNAITVQTGQTVYVSSSVSSGVSISNSNSSVATASFSGNQISVTGVASGQTTITLCVAGQNCQALTVTVPAVVTTTTTVTTPPTFSSSNTLSMQAGANQVVTISGAGGFTLSNNSNPSVVGASVVGNNIYVMANSQGGDNLTICDQSNQCSVLYVSVSGTVAQTSVPITLVSFTVASNNNQGSFLHIGSNIQFSFNTNIPVTNATVVVGNAHIDAVGSGSGPYTASYTMGGYESIPIPVTITVSDANNNSGQFSFSLGAGVPATTAPPAPVVVSTPVNTTTTTSDTATSSVTTPSIMLYKFKNYLYEGMTSTDVLALQERLKLEGVFRGPSTGFFGPLTVAAVKVYQAKHGLDQLGVVGPATRSSLNNGN